VSDTLFRAAQRADGSYGPCVADGSYDGAQGGRREHSETGPTSPKAD
jgi:hypothetical protein